jgi:prevent-host-death family protein
MNLLKDIRTISELKGRTAQLLAEVNRDRRPIIITQNGKARAVVLDPESYEKLTNAIAMMALMSQSEEEINQGKWIPQAEVFRRLEAKYGTKRRNGRPHS